MAGILEKNGIIVIASFISPYQADRKRARDLSRNGEFIEIFCRCSLWVCEQRDPKGLYPKARAGEIPEFTGISVPYEEPGNPGITLETDKESVEESVEKVIAFLEEREIIRSG